ncbi:hypothetical protein RRG08_023551 [Elysia crispata]|uniref:Cytochrome c oxidase subunit 7C, mitochondrial n=1 Tax=Elysia crispata TaxID=231223 RepID=A0AAE1DC61_9GAST|nr:hypothetical protein RRG08_023551 [Elysia crispata]
MFPLGKFATKELFLGMQSSLRRALSTSQKLMSQEWQQQGVPGSNLPFPINCRYKLTLLFTLFFGSALSAPFIIARRHLLLVNNKEPPVPPQELTTIICFDEKELKDVDSFPED